MRTYGLFIVLLVGVGCTEEPTCAAPLPCPSSSPWDAESCDCKPAARCETSCAEGASLNATTCACEAADAAAGVSADATSACLPSPCPLGSPWDAASCSCKRSCELDVLLSLRSAGSDTRDCGVLNANATADALMQAQRCVLDGLRARAPFKLVHWLQGTDSAVAEAYAPPLGAGSGTQSLVSVLHYDSDPSGGNLTGAHVGEQTCQDLMVDPDCQLSGETLCLSCVGKVESRIACSAQSDAGDCRGAGNYQSGKEGSYRPCCAGLSEVFHQSAAEVNGAASCVDLPLRVYACVEGRCGDGRCEAAEAVPCGCALDCPAARPMP